MLLLRPPAARFSYGVNGKQAASKDQAFHPACTNSRSNYARA
jgi:hypothetical protein